MPTLKSSLRQLMALMTWAYSIYIRLFSDMQQRWFAAGKESFAVYQSVLKFDLYLRVIEYILCCNHKPLEPFLSKGIKISKQDQWAMEFANYNITSVDIKVSKTT